MFKLHKVENLYLYKIGKFFGDMELFNTTNKGKRIVTAKAMEDCEFLVLHKNVRYFTSNNYNLGFA